MKAFKKRLRILQALIVALGLIQASPVTAQIFTTLHSMSKPTYNGVPFANNDGANPYGGLILSANKLYGTSEFGGTVGYGSIFSINIDGTGFTNLYNFKNGYGGGTPLADLVISGNALYGTATVGYGMVFAINTDGTGYTNLHVFSDNINVVDAASPYGPVLLSANTLYGTTTRGGTNNSGTVFKINTDGTGYSFLHTFSAFPPTPPYANNDGSGPECTLVLSGNTLFGTAGGGGTNGNGTIFKVNIDGSGFAVIYTFSASPNYTNMDGAKPNAGLTLSGNSLYGTATKGGSTSWGTVFKVNTNGTGFAVLHTFSVPLGPNSTNGDGCVPSSTPVLFGNTLYGTTISGGITSGGTLYKVNTDGTGFTVVHAYSAPAGSAYTNSDGYEPIGPLLLANNVIYGTAYYGGVWGQGALFRFSLPAVSLLPPQLAITPSGTNVILTWPTNATGFTLQSATNLSFSIWLTNSSLPMVINMNNVVTNAVTGTQQFFRLMQ